MPTWPMMPRGKAYVSEVTDDQLAALHQRKKVVPRISAVMVLMRHSHISDVKTLSELAVETMIYFK